MTRLLADQREWQILDLLCSFAHRFPLLAAGILDRDQHKRRNFREETITDILMAGLVPFAPFGIRVDFPSDESITGEDMDWEFVNENATDGRRYLRLHIQAKRAISNNGKKKPYWFYRELDHALAPSVASGGSGATSAAAAAAPIKQYGLQHTVLINEAAKIPGCVPIYMLYNPGAAEAPKSGKLPAVEGVNWIFADKIRKKLTPGRWPVEEKKLATLRPNFHPLSKLLCFGHTDFLRFPKNGGTGFALLFDQPACPTPGELSDRLNELRLPQGAVEVEFKPISAVDDIPPATLEAIRSPGGAGKGSAEIPRPRVIFNSSGM